VYQDGKTNQSNPRLSTPQITILIQRLIFLASRSRRAICKGLKVLGRSLPEQLKYRYPWSVVTCRREFWDEAQPQDNCIKRLNTSLFQH